jgi:ABC-type branched-subunit amino acid transport system substrate-binding protein
LSKFFKLMITLAALALLLVPAAGCTDEEDDGDTTPVPDPDPIKIGLAMGLTGGLSGIGGDIRDAGLLAVAEWNAAGGVNGLQIETFVVDTKTDAAGGLEAVKQLHQINGVSYIVGPMASGSVMASGPFCLDNEVLIISPSATSPDITGQPWRDFVYRTAPSDTLQGAAMAQMVIDGGYQTVSILALNNVYGVGLAGVVAETLEDAGIDIVNDIAYDPATLNYLTELQIIKDQNPDCVIYVGYEDDAQVVFTQAGQLGLDSAQWISCDGVAGPNTYAVAEAGNFMASSVIGTRPGAPAGLDARDEFNAAYLAEYGSDPTSYGDFTYDAVNLILQAIENVGSADDVAAVAAEILDIAQDYPGASGFITFDEEGDRTSADFEVWKVVVDPDSTSGFAYVTTEMISL